MAQQYDDRAVPGGALVGRNVAQFFHQQRVVVRVAGALAREARAVDSGRAVQSIDLDTGIVGQRRQAGQGGGVPCLDDRVFDEGSAGFRDFADAELGLRVQFIAEIGEHRRQFAQLAGVSRGQYQLLHACACNSKMRSIPPRASDSMALSSASLKAPASAVP